jgi:hypothetical protein
VEWNGRCCSVSLKNISFCRELLKDGFYGDSLVLHGIAMHWNIKVTVLNSRTLRETRFRHNAPMEKADIVLVYNGIHHYVGACKL